MTRHEFELVIREGIRRAMVTSSHMKAGKYASVRLTAAAMEVTKLVDELLVPRWDKE